MWIGATEAHALGGAHHLYALSELGGTFASQNLALWLLGSVVALAFALIRRRYTTIRRQATFAAG